jgi:hypothetical protein
VLPEQYQESREDVRPTPMRSAALKFDASGRVAWNDIWATFCDLAMAGGPPHKGTLIEPGDQAAIDAAFDRYDEVAEEIARGIRMVTGLRAYPSAAVGWVSVTCRGDSMADWLARAITMENVAARRSGSVLELPAAPHFRVEKEIKNVVTVTAKTCHYWAGHIPAERQRAIGELFLALGQQSPLVQPDYTGAPDARRRLLSAAAADAIRLATGLERSSRQHPHWLGLECGHTAAAIWMMQALVVSNVMARREETTLLVPVNPAVDPEARRLIAAVSTVYALLPPMQVSP